MTTGDPATTTGNLATNTEDLTMTTGDLLFCIIISKYVLIYSIVH